MSDPSPPSSSPTEDPAPDPETSTTQPPPPPPPTTTTQEPPTTEPTEDPTTSTTLPPESTTSQPPPEETTTTPPESTTSSEPETTTEPSTTSQEPTTTTSTTSEETSTTEEPTTEQLTTFTTITSDGQTSTKTDVITVTNTRTEQAPPGTTSAESTETATPIDPSGDGSGGLSEGGKVAIGVVVPIVAIAILAIAGLFFWKKRKARLAAEEERRKEVEDYSYNPNADPSYPAMGGVVGGDGYEMREDTSSGYRGWGTTLAGSTGRKASTTMSGGGMGAYSDATSPTQANASLARADESHSPEGEILGAMGPSANNNRGTGVNRGPSNASSSYSAAGRSDGSDGAMGVGYGGGATYYDQQNGNPYSDNPYGGPQEMPTQPVIRDNPARRNTRIENPSHYPQQSAGISQNF